MPTLARADVGIRPYVTMMGALLLTLSLRCNHDKPTAAGWLVNQSSSRRCFGAYCFLFQDREPSPVLINSKGIKTKPRSNLCSIRKR